MPSILRKIPFNFSEIMLVAIILANLQEKFVILKNTLAFISLSLLIIFCIRIISDISKFFGELKDAKNILYTSYLLITVMFFCTFEHEYFYVASYLAGYISIVIYFVFLLIVIKQYLENPKKNREYYSIYIVNLAFASIITVVVGSYLLGIIVLCFSFFAFIIFTVPFLLKNKDFVRSENAKYYLLLIPINVYTANFTIANKNVPIIASFFFILVLVSTIHLILNSRKPRNFSIDSGYMCFIYCINCFSLKTIAKHVFDFGNKYNRNFFYTSGNIFLFISNLIFILNLILFIFFILKCIKRENYLNINIEGISDEK